MVGSFNEIAGLKNPLRLHMAVLPAGGKVHAAGSIGAEYNAITNTEINNPANGAWKTVGAFPFLAGGKVVSAKLYHPASGRWRPTGSMTALREGHTAGSLVPLHSDRFLGK